MTQFKRGDQIAYIPDHARGDPHHPDVEHGFITSVRGDIAFCRYWHNFYPYQSMLRTQSNSEGTPVANLVHEPHWKSQVDVDALLEDM